MYAIIETGGKQYRVQEGLTLKVELLAAEPGTQVTLDKVLAVGQGADLRLGQPYVSGASVTCDVVEHGRAKKVIIFKKRRRHDSRKKQGHRQGFTTLKISAITA